MSRDRPRSPEKQPGGKRGERKRRGAGAAHPRQASPRPAEEQEAPAEERPPTPDEERGQAIEEMEEPPQAEGPRDTR